MRLAKSGWSAVSVLGVSLLIHTAAGCGSGSTSTTGSSGSRQRVQLFVTDSFREDVDQVFLTVVKVELIGQDGSIAVAYDDPAGHQFDAKSLRDDAGQIYNFLASATVPSRLYSAVRLTLDGGITISPKDQLLTKTLQVDDSFPRDEQGRAQLQFPLTTPRDLSADEGNLVIDVDLANFRYNGSSIVPAVAEGSREGLADLSRQQNDEYRGVVANLTDDRFELTLGNTRSLPVTVASDAIVFGSGGTGRAVLAGGQTVEVVGKLDLVSGRFLASEIRTVDSADGEIDPVRPQVNGTVTQSDLAEGTGAVTLRTGRLKGFRPVEASVIVETSAVTTTFIARDGSTITGPEFYAALQTGRRIYAEGAYDAATNRLTATIAKLE